MLETIARGQDRELAPEEERLEAERELAYHCEGLRLLVATCIGEATESEIKVAHMMPLALPLTLASVVAVAAVVERRHALAADAELLARLRAGRNLDRAALAVEAGHVDLAAERGGGDRDRRLRVERRAVALEQLVRAQVDEDVEVAGGAVAEARLALARHADPRALVDARRHLDLKRLAPLHAAGAEAGLARVGDDLADAAAGRAGAFDDEEALLHAHLAGAVAGAAGLHLRTGLGEATDEYGLLGLTGYGPNINVIKDPRYGRNSELPGEDPVLTGEYAVNYVKGMQQTKTGKGGKPVLKMLSSLKHYTAYSVETSRFTFSASVTNFTLHDSNLPQYEAAFVEGGASGAMCCKIVLVMLSPFVALPALLTLMVSLCSVLRPERRLVVRQRVPAQRPHPHGVEAAGRRRHVRLQRRALLLRAV